MRKILLLIALIVAATSCQKNSNQQDEAAKAIPVKVVRLEKGSISRELEFTGDVRGEVEIRVFPQVADRVISLPVKEGQRVQRGQVIAIIRSDALSSGVESAEAALSSAQVAQNQAEDDLARIEQLFKSGAVGRAQLDQARTSLELARARVAQARAGRDQIHVQRTNAIVVSPINGLVGNLAVEQGDMAVPQFPLATIVQTGKVKVVVQVTESDLPLVRLGMPVLVRVASFSDRVFRGTLHKISPMIDRETRTAEAEIMIDNNDGLLRPGMLAKATIVVEEKKDVVLAPIYALALYSEGSNGDRVFQGFVVKAGRSEARRVKIGIIKGETAEVREGLFAGDTLVTRGQHLLDDGSPVNVVQESPANQPERARFLESGAPATVAAQSTTGGR